MNPIHLALTCALAAALATLPAAAQEADAHDSDEAILARWQDGLVDPQCRGAIPRWHLHYDRHINRLLGARNGGRLQLFASVTDALREAGLPTEYAVIPLLESDYNPGARSPWGQAGLWQFTAATARMHGLQVGQGKDERLSAEASTRAAVAYLRKLHRMFGGDWRWTAIAYNAGDGAARRARRNGSTSTLPGITRAYPDKLHTAACLLLAAAGRGEAPAQGAEPGARTHVVRAGDTLWGLARQYGVPIAGLMQANGLHPGSRLAVGQRLTIPGSGRALD